MNWDGFWLTNGDVEETVVAECQVLSINNVSDPELPNWFTEVLNGTDLDGHRDITIEFSDSGGNNLGLNVCGRSLPSQYIFPFFDVTSFGLRFEETFVFKPESLAVN